jgi:hypothetical protein
MTESLIGLLGMDLRSCCLVYFNGRPLALTIMQVSVSPRPHHGLVRTFSTPPPCISIEREPLVLNEIFVACRSHVIQALTTVSLRRLKERYFRLQGRFSFAAEEGERRGPDFGERRLDARHPPWWADGRDGSQTLIEPRWLLRSLLREASISGGGHDSVKGRLRVCRRKGTDRRVQPRKAAACGVTPGLLVVKSFHRSPQLFKLLLAPSRRSPPELAPR